MIIFAMGVVGFLVGRLLLGGILPGVVIALVFVLLSCIVVLKWRCFKYTKVGYR